MKKITEVKRKCTIKKKILTQNTLSEPLDPESSEIILIFGSLNYMS